MQNPGLNVQMIHQAEEQNYSRIKVNLKEEEEDEQSAEKIKVINPEQDQPRDWCENIRAEIILYKEEVFEFDARDSNREETKAGEPDEPKLSHTGAGGKPLVFQDECGSSDGVMWLRMSSDSEARQEGAGCTDAKSQHNQKTDLPDNLTTQEQQDTEAEDETEDVETSEPGTGGKLSLKLSF